MIARVEMGRTNGSKVLLLGAGFETGNLGVEALAIGTIQIIQAHYPDARIQLLEYGATRRQYTMEINGNPIELATLNIRFSKKIWQKNHILWLMLCGIAARLFPFLRRSIRSRNPHYREIDDAAVGFSIAGGDSFSDIYGLERFIYVTLPQLLLLFMKKRLILLPQTLGPYRTRISRVVTGYVLRKAESVYCRDRKSIAYIADLFGTRVRNVGFCHDVAFGLRPEKKADGDPLNDLAGSPLVGLNVSGLLYFDRSNRFHLECEYPRLIGRILDYFCTNLGQRVLLMPHVITTEEGAESDVRANAGLMEQYKAKYGDRLLCASGITSAAGAKAVIGRCDFFLGSRMHACIGALSQGIPAIGLAYSGKFAGLFATVGVESLALDLTQLAEDQLIKRIEVCYGEREKWREALKPELARVNESYEGMAGKWKNGMVSA